MINQGLRPFHNSLLQRFVFLAFFIQGLFELFEKVVELLLYLPVVAEFYRPRGFPLFPGSLMDSLGSFPVDGLPVSVVEEGAELLTDCFPGLQVCFFQPGLCRKIDLAGFIGQVRGLFES